MKGNTVNERLINIIFQLSRLIRKEMASSSRVAHLSILQLEILVYLKTQTKTHIHAIVQYFHINKSTVSSHLETLEKMKLVTRKIDTKDHRIVHILLTNKGSKLLIEGLKEKNKRMNKLLTYISSHDKRTLLTIITNLLNTLHKTYDD